MLPKIIRFDEPYFEQTGEPRVQIVSRKDSRFSKYASEDTMGYLSTVQPEAGKTSVLVLAMSAGEFYGPNRNGDAFAEAPVQVAGKWAVAAGETLPDHHKSFEEHGHVFQHHINKDPLKALGNTVKSFYNWKMHRVELLVSLDHDKAGHIVQRIDAGEFPGVSMGCRIKYDVCSICGNRAPTRAQYCEHINGSNPEYGMNRLLSDGRRCFVWNPSPLLFDISFVFKPADKIGYMMKKVAMEHAPYKVITSADRGLQVANLSEKRALLLKLSDIDKIYEGKVVDPRDGTAQEKMELLATKRYVDEVAKKAVRPEAMLQDSTLDQIAGISLPEFLSSMSACGMVPTSGEIFRFLLKKEGLSCDETMLRKIQSAQGQLAEILAELPQLLEAVEDTGLVKVSQHHVLPYVVRLLAPYMEKRALWKDDVARRAHQKGYIGEGTVNLLGTTGAINANNVLYNPTSEVLHYDDPRTGNTYQTTRRAAERTDWENTKKFTMEAAGIAGLTAAATKAVSSKNKWLAAPTALGGALVGHNIMKHQGVPDIETREGVKIPMQTEMVKLNSASQQLAGGALLALLAGQEVLPVAPSSVSQFVQENPMEALLGGTTAVAGGVHLNANRKGITDHVVRAIKKIASEDPAVPDQVDLGDALYKIGQWMLSR